MTALTEEELKKLEREGSPIFIAPMLLRAWTENNPGMHSFLVVAADRDKCITCGVMDGLSPAAALALEMTENEELRKTVYRAIETYEFMKDKL